MSFKETIYNAAPYSVKNIIASAYGRKLYKRRYLNRFYIENLPKIADRNLWTIEQIENYQFERIKEILLIAAHHVPYYRDLFKRLKINPEQINSIREFTEQVPILEKQTVKDAPELFLDERQNIKHLNKIYTSGTTGSPLCVYRDEEADGLVYSFSEGRWLLPYGISKDSSWAMIGGKLIVPQKQATPPFWVWNSGMNQLYMSSYHLSEKFMGYYLEELEKRHLDYIYGYASSLYSLALFAQKIKFNNLRFKVAISNAEPLYDHQRILIEKVFRCKVVDTYGCTEFCFQASECAEGKMHVSPDVGLFEVVSSDLSPAGKGEVGNVVCTGFVNLCQPLMRYRTGDSAVMSKYNCDCGSNFQLLQSIEGRNDDLIITADGRRIGRMDPVFKAELPIREAQIVQNSLNDFSVLLVPEQGWNNHHEKELKDSFINYVGEVQLSIEKVDHIARTKAGKFKAVVNKMNNSKRENI